MYILECSDGTLYTGITNGLEKRIALHNMGKGAKYTRGRGPVKLKHVEEIEGRGPATKREIEIKKLEKDEKMALMG